MINLDLLRSFLAVVRHGSVTRAANALALSQPALSARLQALEVRFGKPLFLREGRGIRTTPAGRALAKALAPHLDGLETIFGAFGQRSDDVAGVIRIDGPHEFIERFVVPMLDVLIGMGIRPAFCTSPADQRIGALETDEIDLAILTTGARSPAITTQRLFREHFVLIAAPRWAEALRSGADAAAAAGELPMLAFADSLPIVRRYWSEIFGQEPEFAAAVILPDLRSLVAATIAGSGATVAPHYLSDEDVEAGRLLQHAPRLPLPGNDVELAWRRGALHPRAALVRDLLLRGIGGDIRRRAP